MRITRISLLQFFEQHILHRKPNHPENLSLPPEPSIKEISRFLASVPGMIDVERCLFHMGIASGQDVLGDVVEIGAWQGRNSIALAAGCRSAKNGKVVVIDHFKGNPGTEDFYRVGRPDLSDLFDNFTNNVSRSGLTEWIEVFPKAREDFNRTKRIRLLFIDGNHSYEAVAADLAHFESMLCPGAIVILDDYSPEFPGVVQAAAEFLSKYPHAVAQQIGRDLVIRLPTTRG